jgi:FkbM family methyltransferase
MLNLSRISSGSLVGRMLRAPLRLIPPSTVLRVLSGPARGSRWIAGSTDHGAWLGTYEFDKQRVFGSLVQAGTTVWDIGAHVGVYSLLSSMLVGPRGLVVAFEPVPSNLELLREHIRLNNLSNVRVVEAAVTDHVGEESFEYGQSSSTGHLGGMGDVRVKSVTLDSLAASREFPRPNVIKMDIEGAEAAALRGAGQLLGESHPVILLALHGPQQSQESRALLNSLGYSLESLVKGQPVESADEVLATWHG